LRLRVEGGTTATFCPEFDEIRLGRTLADITGRTVDVRESVTLQAQISPNPTKSNLNITLDNDNQLTKVVVSDMLGRSVLTGQFMGNQADVNVSNLAKGMYFIHLQSAGKSVTEKFVKE
jgi:hypothetical protein